VEPPGQRRRGLEHQPPLRHDLQPVGPRGEQRLLRLPERHHEQPRTALEPVQPADQRVGLVDRLRPGQRHPGEVQEVAAQPAPHHPVRGDRRVDAAGHQRDRPAAHPDRQSALARLPAGEHEHLALVDLDEDLRVRVLEVHRQPVRLLHRPADDHRELGGGDREPLVPPPRPHRERAARGAGQRDRGGDGRLRGLLHPPRPADPGDPRHVADPLGHPVHRGRVLGGRPLLLGDADHDDALAQQQVDGQPGVAGRGPDVAVQQPLELVPVTALEDDFAEFQQHARLADGLLRRPGHRDGIGHGHPSSLPGPVAPQDRLAEGENQIIPNVRGLLPDHSCPAGGGGRNVRV